MDRENLHLGSCSWKYDSWQGLVYSKHKAVNYLKEYSRHYGTVEIDQWFWSLFSGDKVVLPKPATVQEYAASVPEGFLFGIKVPNSITLTHHYKKQKSDSLTANPHYLSVELMGEFLECLTPLSKNLGPLIFQFEYLNKQKVPGGLPQFIDQFGKFAEQLPAGLDFCVETRNSNYLSEKYFGFLSKHGLYHVFLQGYYLPPIFQLYRKYRQKLQDLVVIRLHGPDRAKIEAQSGKDWSRLVAPKDDDIAALAEMLLDVNSRGLKSFVFVNNHFEGSSPRTIVRIEESLKKAQSKLQSVADDKKMMI